MWSNWARNIEIECPVVSPTNTDALCEMVENANFGVIGRGFSFNSHLYGTNPKFLIDLSSLEKVVEVSSDASEASITPSVTLKDLAIQAHSKNLQLLNFPSRLDFSVIGCIATGSHGSGKNASISSMVKAFSLLDFQNGRITQYTRGDDDFLAKIILPNRFGIVTKLTLELTKVLNYVRVTLGGFSFDDIPDLISYLSQEKANFSIYLNVNDESRNSLIFTGIEENVKRISASVFTLFHSSYIGRLDARGLSVLRDDEYMETGSAHELFPHSEQALPVAGQELQSEYFFLIDDVDIVYQTILTKLHPNVFQSLRSIEIRYLEKNEVFYSPSYGVDVIGIHFTWRNNPTKVSEVVILLENSINESLKGGFMRTHWGKIFSGSIKKYSETFDRSELLHKSLCY